MNRAPNRAPLWRNGAALEAAWPSLSGLDQPGDRAPAPSTPCGCYEEAGAPFLRDATGDSAAGVRGALANAVRRPG